MLWVKRLLILTMSILATASGVAAYKYPTTMVHFCDSDTNKKLDNCIGIYMSEGLVLTNAKCLRKSNVQTFYMYGGDSNMDCSSGQGQRRKPTGYLKLRSVISMIGLEEDFKHNEKLTVAEKQFVVPELTKETLPSSTCYTYTTEVSRRYKTQVFPCEGDDNEDMTKILCGSLEESIPDNVNLKYLPVLCDDSFAGYIAKQAETLTIVRITEGALKRGSIDMMCLVPKDVIPKDPNLIEFVKFMCSDTISKDITKNP